MSLSVDIEKSFKGFSLNVAFDAGQETVGLLGESGCGKTLTMRCIAGIETPDAGKIVVNDTVFFDKAPGKKAKVNLTAQQRKTALLFQNYMLFPNLTVEQNVGAGVSKGTPDAERERIVSEELKRFGIEKFRKRWPVQLSGGQQQRVALARMLAANPGILMLDEPLSALDAHLKGILEQNLTSMFDTYSGTVLYVSHDIDEAMRFCDRIVVINEGRIMEISSCEQLVNNPQSEASIKLSGCKNLTPVEKRGDHLIFMPRWGVELEVEQEVPDDVKAMGVRAFYLERMDGPGHNTFRMACDRVSDARFDRAVLLGFLDSELSEEDREAANENEMTFLHQHLFWRVDKLAVAPEDVPEHGDEVWIRIPEDKIYLVSK